MDATQYREACETVQREAEEAVKAMGKVVDIQTAKADRDRKEIWEALNPNSGATCATIADRGRGRPQEFASETAEVSGESKSQINRHVARAEALGDQINEVVGTSLDKGVELDALKDMGAEDRQDLIDRAKAGEQVSARDYSALTAKDDPDRLRKMVVQAIAEVAKLANYGTATQVRDIAFMLDISQEAYDFLYVLELSGRLYRDGLRAA